MSISRKKSFDEQSSIPRRIAFYYEGWKAKKYVDQFGVAQMRVIIVTTTPGRVENMVDAVREPTGGKGSNFLLFADFSGLGRSIRFNTHGSREAEI